MGQALPLRGLIQLPFSILRITSRHTKNLIGNLTMRAFGIILALALTTGASAQGRLPDIAYNGVSAGYTRTDLDGTSQDADSFSWGATYEVSDLVHVCGSIDRTTFEETIVFPEIFPSDFGDVPLGPDFENLTLDIPPLKGVRAHGGRRRGCRRAPRPGTGDTHQFVSHCVGDLAHSVRCLHSGIPHRFQPIRTRSMAIVRWHR